MESVCYYCVLAKKVPAYGIKDGRLVLESLEGEGCELVDRTPAAGRAHTVPGVGLSSCLCSLQCLWEPWERRASLVLTAVRLYHTEYVQN